MTLLDEVVKAAPSLVDTDLIRWGQVISTGPLKVRFAGDTTDSTIALQADGITLVSGDKVAVIKLGAQWVVVSKLVAPADASGGTTSNLLSMGHWGPYESGKFYSGWNWTYNVSTTSTMAHDYAYLIPVVLTSTVTLTSLVCTNTTTAVSFKWGLYDSTDTGYPNSLLDSGEDTQTTADRVISLTADLTLTPGIYWMTVNPSTACAWYYVAQISYSIHNAIYTLELGYATASGANRASHSTSAGTWRLAHTYEDALPDPFAGSLVSAGAGIAYTNAFEVA